MPLLGNVIFHAFSAPYVGCFFFSPAAVLVVGVEALALWVWNRSASAGAVVSAAAGANVASYLVGFLLGPLLLVGGGLVVDRDDVGVGSLALGPDWLRLARLAFVQAWAVSVVVEAAVLIPFRRAVGLRRVVAPVVVGNVVSYAILYAIFMSVFGGVGRDP